MSSGYSNNNRLAKRYWFGLNKTLNPLGFGCWQISGSHNTEQGNPNGWGEVSETEATRLIHVALDHGVQFFDTAMGYGHGRSETLLGHAIQSARTRTEPIVCTKIPLSDHECLNNALSETFLHNVEASLKRLKRHQIDVLLLHNPPDNIDWATFDASLIYRLQESGKVGTFGISAKSYSGLRDAVESKFGTCVEWSFNMFERRSENLFPKLIENEMNFIARSPLSRGLLSERYINKSFSFGSEDFRSTLPRKWITWVRSNVKNLKLTATEKENLSKIALQYCSGFPEVSVVIPGIKQQHHLEACLKTQSSDFLSRSLMSRIESDTEPYYPDWG